jgi:o-succinylbenzoate synthase
VSPLRIVRAKVWRYALPLVRPMTSARGVLSERAGLILELESDGGERGLGEAAPFPGLSKETLAQAEQALLDLASEGSPLRAAELQDVSSIRALLARLALPSSAAHALDQALLSMLASRREIAPAHLLHPVARTEVPEHALALGPEEAVALVQLGYTTLKVKVGASCMCVDEPRIAAIRRAVGDEVLLRLDANGAWSPPQAIDAIERLAEYGLDSVEQPVAAADLAGMRKVRASVSVPIAADESVRTLEDLSRVVEAEAADAVVVKPMLAGGVLAAHALCCAAARAGLAVSVTTTLESAIGRAAARDVALVCPAPLWTCGLDTGHLLARDLDPSAFGAGLGEGSRSAARALGAPAPGAVAEVIPFPRGRR